MSIPQWRPAAGALFRRLLLRWSNTHSIQHEPLSASWWGHAGKACDTASATSGASMSALLKLATPQHILFGSDYPYVKTESSIEELSQVKVSAQDRVAIERQNPERLMPRLKV